MELDHIVKPDAACFRCGHRWKRRRERPNVCPSCHSMHWDEARAPKIGRPLGSKNKAKRKKPKNKRVAKNYKAAQRARRMAKRMWE